MAYQVAEVYAWRGEKNKAFEWLQISLDNHDTGLLSLLIDPLMRSLKRDPRYNALLEKIGLPLSKGKSSILTNIGSGSSIEQRYR